MIANPEQTSNRIPAPPPSWGREVMERANPRYLFFNRGTGCWIISPKVGCSEAFARVRAVEDMVPSGLAAERWDMWDIGHRRWYVHKGINVSKGGDTAFDYTKGHWGEQGA